MKLLSLALTALITVSSAKERPISPQNGERMNLVKSFRSLQDASQAPVPSPSSPPPSSSTPESPSTAPAAPPSPDASEGQPHYPPNGGYPPYGYPPSPAPQCCRYGQLCVPTGQSKKSSKSYNDKDVKEGKYPKEKYADKGVKGSKYPGKDKGGNKGEICEDVCLEYCPRPPQPPYGPGECIRYTPVCDYSSSYGPDCRYECVRYWNSPHPPPPCCRFHEDCPPKGGKKRKKGKSGGKTGKSGYDDGDNYYDDDYYDNDYYYPGNGGCQLKCVDLCEPCVCREVCDYGGGGYGGGHGGGGGYGGHGHGGSGGPGPCYEVCTGNCVPDGPYVPPYGGGIPPPY